MAVAEPHVTAATPRRRGGGRILPAGAARWINWSLAGLLAVVTLVALLAPLIAPHDPLQPVGMPQLSPGQGGFLLGSDSIGRDILSRVLFGLRTSWFAALAVIASGLVVGGTVGLVAGTVGGFVDDVLMRVTDGFLALPAPVLAIAVVAALGPSFPHTLLAVAIVWWPFYARIVRGETRALAARPHVEAARLAGAGPFSIALRHLAPGALPAAVVTASLDIGNLVLTLAGLSFLGLGQPAPAPELGADSARNLQFLLQYSWIPVMPGLAVLLLALVGNVAGDAIRNLMDDR
ncbi:ABC transporter permease [Streptomyces sp. NPDC006602]|uniref:ABC transporter permease n=1 Tax=Streptomyces sp. NPDC006602 TaxID=3364751 RepID=UPI0036758F17